MAPKPELEIDVHRLPVGKKKGDDSFADGYRRKGPEGLPREVVVLEVDEKGAAKVAERVRQLIDKKLAAFVVDLSGVSTLEGATVKEILRAKKLAEEVKRAIGAGTNRIVVDLSSVAGDAAGAGAIAEAAATAREKKARVLFTGISAELRSAAGAKDLEIFESEVEATEQLAVDVLE